MANIAHNLEMTAVNLSTIQLFYNKLISNTISTVSSIYQDKYQRVCK